MKWLKNIPREWGFAIYVWESFALRDEYEVDVPPPGVLLAHCSGVHQGFDDPAVRGCMNGGMGLLNTM